MRGHKTTTFRKMIDIVMICNPNKYESVQWMNQQKELSALCKVWKQLPDKVVARDLMASHRHALSLAKFPNLSVVHARLGQKAPLNLTLQAGNGRRRKVWILFLLVKYWWRETGDESRIHYGIYWCLKFASVKCWGPTALAKERFHSEQSVGILLMKVLWVRHDQAVEGTWYKYIIHAPCQRFFRLTFSFTSSCFS